MKFSVNCGQISRWLQPNQLVILLLCFLETIQCHSIAEAGSDSTQDFQTLTPTKPSNSLKILLVHQRNNLQPASPPINADSQLEVTQTSTTSRPTSPSSANNHNQRPSSTTTTTASPKQRWIDNILINVEVMNMSNERRRQQQIASESRLKHSGEQDEEAQHESPITVTAFEESPSFQMPTDSGEDLLESQSDTSTSSSDQPVSGQRFDTDDQKLIESNNVSAILAQESLQPRSAQVAFENNQAQIVTMASKQVMSCEAAYTQCALREVCAPTLKLYNDECHDLLNNRTDECSAKCLRAMIALRSSEAGEDLANCDCQANEFCQLSKQRSQLCQAQVERALEPTSVVSCSVASSICMANQLCSTALGYYYEHCQSLFSQRHCSDRCNNSLTVLHKQPQAMKLVNCQCDGSEEFPCVRYKTYTERLCLNKQTAPTTGANESSSSSSPEEVLESLDEATGASHLLDDVADEDDPQAAAPASNEDDRLNLTNDPSDLPPTLAQAVGQADDEFGAGPPSDGTDLANANNYFLTGIQQPAAIEDNWIPLVSGRYFTNLQQKQQRRQQQQQQQKVKQQQQRKSKSRRAQKNAKQKVRPNETNRKRHAERYMFALTSAATQASHSFILLAASGLALALPLLTFP